MTCEECTCEMKLGWICECGETKSIESTQGYGVQLICVKDKLKIYSLLNELSCTINKLLKEIEG